VDPREEKTWPLPGLEFRSLGRPARSQSLYRIRVKEKISQSGNQLSHIDSSTENFQNVYYIILTIPLTMAIITEL
jgi:hypothetical protein